MNGHDFIMVNTTHHLDGCPFEPPKQAHGPRSTSPLKLLRTVDYIRQAHDNPLTVFTREYYQNPIVERQYLGSTYLHVYDSDLIDGVLNKKARAFRFDYLRKAVLRPVIGKGLLISDDQNAPHIRRTLAPLFASSARRGGGNKICTALINHIQRISEHQDRPINVSRLISWTAMDMLSAYTFSDSASMDTQTFSAVADELFAVQAKPHIIDILQLSRFLPKVLRSKQLAQIDQLRDIMTELVDTRHIRGPNSHFDRDLLDLLLDACDEEGVLMGEDDVVDNLLTFISAGHQTITNSLLWCVYLISRQAAVQSRIQDEIDTASLDPDRTMQWADKLPFLKACLKETLRLYPAVALISRRAIEPVHYKGHTIKTGTTVHICPWVLHRHQTLWDEPDLFNPDRFLNENEQKIPRNAYLPFGTGARRCISEHLAMEIMMVMLAGLFKHFTFYFDGHKEPEPRLDLCIRPSMPMTMRLEPRNHERFGF